MRTRTWAEQELTPRLNRLAARAVPGAERERAEHVRPASRRSVQVAVVAMAAVIAAVSLVVANGSDERSGSPIASAAPAVTRILMGADETREGHVAVATTSGVFVWGGAAPSIGTSAAAAGQDASPAGHDGLLLDVSTGDATPVRPGPLDRRVDATATWTGEEVVVLGGHDGGSAENAADGARYRPDTDVWERIPAAPNCIDVATRWDGGIAAAGGCDRADASTYGVANLDLGTWTWTALPRAPRPVLQLTGEGNQLVALLSDRSIVELSTGGDSWRPVEAPPVALDPNTPVLLTSADGQLVVVGATTDADGANAQTVVLQRGLAEGPWTVNDALVVDRPDEPPVVREGDVLWWESLGGVAWFDLADAKGGSIRRDDLVRSGASITALPGGRALLLGGRVPVEGTSMRTSRADGFVIERP